MTLSQERILEIQERLKGLSQEEQQEKLNEILKELPPEELEELTKHQCLFCDIANKKIDAKVVYEDDIVIAILDINPTSNGHTIIFPKKHYQFLFQVSDIEIERLFKIVNKISLAIINGLNAEGNNIFVANGQVAGQSSPHTIIHIIPRYKNDNIEFKWDFKKIDEKEMLKILNIIKNNIITHKEVKIDKQTKIDYEEEERIA